MNLENAVGWVGLVLVLLTFPVQFYLWWQMWTDRRRAR